MHLSKVGKFQSQSSQAFCELCGSGKFQSHRASVECLKCKLGRFGGSGRNQACVALCPAGKFSELEGSCQHCPKGKYQPMSGAEECKLCPSGRFGAEYGSSAKMCSGLCPAGKYCPTGSSSPQLCDATTYCPRGSELPLPLLVGHFRAFKNATENATVGVVGAHPELQRGGQLRLTQVPCPDSYFCQNGVKQICPPGHYCANNCSKPIVCPSANKFCPEGSAEAKEVLAGFFSTANRSRQEICIVGTYCSGGVRYACNDGFFAAANGSTMQKPCADGHYTNTSTAHGSCLICPAGHFEVKKTMCHACRPGRTSAAGESACTDCAPGKHAKGNGNPRCTLCNAGQSAASPGQAECHGCKRGQISEVGAAQCIACHTGTYASGNQANCTECPAGTFSNAEAMVKCAVCEQGKFAESAGHSECKACAPGQFSNVTASTSCRKCLPGTYAGRPGSSSCDLCELGKFLEHSGSIAESRCQGCGPRSSTLVRGADSPHKCVCDEELLEIARDPSTGFPSCRGCPLGGNCTARGVSTRTMPVLPHQYRASSNTTKVHACTLHAACCGGSNVTTSCCEGYTGHLCEVCDYEKGFARKFGLMCTKCSEGEGVQQLFTNLAVLGVLILAIATVTIHYIKRAHARNLHLDVATERIMGLRRASGISKEAAMRTAPDNTNEHWTVAKTATDARGGHAHILTLAKSDATANRWMRLKILVSFFQCAYGMAASFRVSYPAPVVQFMQLLAFVSMDWVAFFSVECLQPADYYFQLSVLSAGPVTVTLLMFAAEDLLRPAHLEGTDRFQFAFPAFLLLTFGVYPVTTVKALQYFDCRTFEDGVSSLVADKRVICLPTTPTQATLPGTLQYIDPALRIKGLRHADFRPFVYFTVVLYVL